MLRITVSKNAAAATKYFEEGLSKQDYYSEKNEVKGKWHGKLAKEFGLEGEVTKKQFQQLAANINPVTGEKLNVRNSPNRRAGYDFTFSAPKSVSLVYALTKDKQIIAAFDHAVQTAMTAVERDMQTQQGQGKNKEYITTGNIAYAAFTHFKARPVNGIPDTHLHGHRFVFNSTKHPDKQRMQAGEFSQLHYNRTYYQAIANAQLAKNMQKIGYEIERDEHHFQIKNIERSTIEKFSNRTKEIEQEAAKLGLRSDRLKDGLGKKTRAEKNRGLSDTEIERHWFNRLNASEKQVIFSAKNSGRDEEVMDNQKSQRQVAREVLDYALSHHLERQSVISEKQLLATAIKRGIGSVAPAAVQREYSERKDVLAKTDRRTKDKVITTQAALAEEKKLIDTARAGRGNYESLNPDYRPANPQLTSEQSNAIHHVLTSRDFITVVTGGAGTGKTWSIKEVAQGVQQAGKSFSAFAPSAAASRGVQREEGFAGAETIASLLQSKKLQEQTKDGVIWLDEGGMVGNKTMNRVLDIAQKQNARVLITGDVKQHNSVERGDALRVLQRYGGIQPALITKIQRQKNTNYKQAVDFISKGEIEKGYQTLNQMGAIKEVVDLPSLQRGVANEYVTAVKGKEKVLVVATTHAQGQAATTAIRGELQAAGLLAKKEKTIAVQRDLSFTTAQKGDTANYQTGQSIQFRQNMKGGIKRGQRYDVVGKDDQGNVQLTLAGAASEKKKTVLLPMTKGEHFTVYQKGQIKLAEGDKIRITGNGYSKEKKRLDNGNMMTVHGFDRQGNILAYRGNKPRNVVTLDKDYRNLTHGYYATSIAAQGKSINKVIIMQSSASGKASSKEQFYVSASRGKLAISVYTDDKEQLLKSVQRSATRTTATEIAGANQLTTKEKYQRKENILRTSLSKVKGMWQSSKQIIGNINQTIKQHVKAKAPVRTK